MGSWIKEEGKIVILLASNGVSEEGGSRKGTPEMRERILKQKYVLHVGLAECGLPEKQQHLSQDSKNFFQKNGVTFFSVDRDTDLQRLPSIEEFDALHISGGYPGLLMYWMDSLNLWKNIVDPFILSNKPIYACSAGAIIMGKGLLFPTNLFAPTRPGILIPRKYGLGFIRGRGYINAAVMPHNGKDCLLARHFSWLAQILSLKIKVIWIADDEVIQI